MADSERGNNLQSRLEAAAIGEQDAWRDLVDEYAPRVFAVLRSQCGDADLADEITQSTFCTVAEKLANYTELGRFESWLFRIAMNRLKDEMRRRRRQAVAVESEALAGLAGEGPERPAHRPDGDDLAALRAAMARLSEADRQIIHLRHFAGLSFKQIAAVLDEPLGTVLARQHRALLKLAEMVAPAEEAAGDGPDSPRPDSTRSGGAARPPSRREEGGGTPDPGRRNAASKSRNR
jgi:RNA polymerase sigma-70 factor (ECF subfamily)